MSKRIRYIWPAVVLAAILSSPAHADIPPPAEELAISGVVVAGGIALVAGLAIFLYRRLRR